MKVGADDEWRVIERLLPVGWEEAARERGAFRRARYTTDPASLLRLLLFHAVNDGGLRETVAQARVSGIAAMSQVALFKRLRTSGGWLAWLGAELARSLREQPRLPQELRPRAIDSTTVQGPASTGTQWRVHYSLDLVDLNCDWIELTDAQGAELLERTPMRRGDVLHADRNYLRPVGVRAAAEAGAYVLVRLRWSHSAMVDRRERPFNALQHAKQLKVRPSRGMAGQAARSRGQSHCGPGGCDETSCSAGSEGRTAGHQECRQERQGARPTHPPSRALRDGLYDPARDAAQPERRARTLPIPLAD